MAHQKPTPATITLTATDMLSATDLNMAPGTKLDVAIAHKLLTLQQRCVDKGFEFNLSLKRLKQIMQQKTCYYSGAKFIDGDYYMKRTLDRVRNTEGYTDDNVVACTFYYNSRKSDLSIEKLKLLLKGMNKFEEKAKAKAKGVKTPKLKRSRTKAKAVKV